MTTYVRWLRRWALPIAVLSAVTFAVALYLCCFALPLHADFSDLLPRDARSVRDLRLVDELRPAKDVTIVVIRAPDRATCERATRDVVAGLATLEPDLIDHVEADDRATRAFIRARRFLYVPLDDLVAARDAIRASVAEAKRRANPLFVDFEAAPKGGTRTRLDELRARRRSAEAALDRSAFVSEDGRIHVIAIRTAFRSADIARSRRLLAALASIRSRVSGVEIGVAAGAAIAVAEHESVQRGMVWSSAITLVLVAAVLLIHLRRWFVVGLVVANVAVATVVAFGLGALTVGHLNIASAFLGSVVAGNGINYGILLSARYQEARADHAVDDALAVALAATLRPTLVAALGASIAYGSLAVTSFRGYAEFAIIGGVGMLVCWVYSVVVLPLWILRFADRIPAAKTPVFGRFVASAFGWRRQRVALVVIVAGSIAATIVAVHFVSGDPFEYDMTRLASDAEDIAEARLWMAIAEQAVGKGVTTRAVIAVEDPAQVPAVVADLRATRATDPQALGTIASILDLVPADQPRKLAVLAEVRTLLDDSIDDLDEADRAEILDLVPPADLRPIIESDLPPETRAMLRERDGHIGRVVTVRPPADFDEWNGRDLIRFASALRASLQGRDGVAVSGGPIIFADVLVTVREDGVLATTVAVIALGVLIVVVVGPNRRALAVLLSTTIGSIAMVAVCALLGVRASFLNFVSVPLVLGLGIDYAINIAARASGDTAEQTLRTTGGTVLVCSLTTMIGYAALLASNNLAIRSFGLASMIGEVTCVTCALALVSIVVGRSGRAGAASP